MKKLTLSLLIISLVGCATTESVKPLGVSEYTQEQNQQFQSRFNEYLRKKGYKSSAIAKGTDKEGKIRAHMTFVWESTSQKKANIEVMRRCKKQILERHTNKVLISTVTRPCEIYAEGNNVIYK